MLNSSLELIPCHNCNTNAYNQLQPVSLIIPYSVLRQVNKLFQRKFPIPRDLMLLPFTSSPHTAQFSAASFNFHYPVVSLRSSSSCIRLLPPLPVNSLFPSIACFRRQFLRYMWPILLTFLRFIVRRMLVYLTQCNTSSLFTGSLQMIFSIIFRHHISKLARCF